MDVDLEGDKALIARQVQRIDHQLLRQHTKTRSSNTPLRRPESAVQALVRHRVEEARRQLAAGDMWADCGFDLHDPARRSSRPGQIQRGFNLGVTKAGVSVAQSTPLGGPAPASSSP